MIKISRATSKECQQGFSLIEIMIAISLVAVMTAIGVPFLTGTNRNNVDAFARRASLLLGQARDRALLTDKLIRLRVDLGQQTMTLEEAPSTFLIKKPSDRLPDSREKEESDKKEAEAFRLVSELMKEPQKMPFGLKLLQVNSPRYKKPVTEGTADVFFFNNGSTDGATIFLETEEKVHWSITLHPVTGLSRLE